MFELRAVYPMKYFPEGDYILSEIANKNSTHAGGGLGLRDLEWELDDFDAIVLLRRKMLDADIPGLVVLISEL